MMPKVSLGEVTSTVTLLLLSGSHGHAAPTISTEHGQTLVTGDAYRAVLQPEFAGFDLEIRGGDGEWHAVANRPGGITFAYFRGGEEHVATGTRATWAIEAREPVVAIGQQAVLDPVRGTVLELNFVCADAGVLIGARLHPVPGGEGGTLWSPPRISLSPDEWDGYLFWGATAQRHEGRISELGPEPTYAGVSPWGQEGDTVPSLDPARPGLIVRSDRLGANLAVVFVDYESRWADSSMFLQRHTPAAMYLYSGYSPAATAGELRWAWLAPLAGGDEETAVERLAARGAELARGVQTVAPPVPDAWRQPVPDFPAALRRPEPVRDIADAVVYTMNEFTRSDYGVELARKVGANVLVRGWFKWAQAPPVHEYRDIPAEIHDLGALFGGGITCSALYHGENGLSEEQVLDMATRGPAAQLIDAWEQPNVRHGTLSNPAYLDYLFRWCREQIDAGVDYLFMDEITAALSGMEGYDDYSLADFREYLLNDCPQTAGWAPDDARWRDDLGIDLDHREVCPTGTMASFDYRAYMRAKGLLERPSVPDNPLGTLWGQFRTFRDDRAWKALTDRIREYAGEKRRTIYISANGIAKYVDLQVLGVWGRWRTTDGHIDLFDSQLPVWRSIVLQGQDVAGKAVPVVLFHDWGFGDPPFPWLAVPPSERETWMRVRGAEIYAAGAFFAFPVLGPFGCDAAKDGTLAEIARQTAFYQRHRDLYLGARYVGCEALTSSDGGLSLAVWWRDEPPTLILHVINRDFRQGRLQARRNITAQLPIADPPESVALFSPDWEGEVAGSCEQTPDGLRVTLPRLEAYAVALLHYSQQTNLSNLRDPARIRPTQRWARPTRNGFRVLADSRVENASELNGFLQGMLHTHLHNPPTFIVNALREGKLLVSVQAVAATGARLAYRVDGRLVQSEDLPDRDGKNDGSAPEYNQVFTFPIPAGTHRLSLENVGADWATINWYEFQGEFGDAE